MEQNDRIRNYLENKFLQCKKRITIARRKRILMQVLSVTLVIGVIVGSILIPAAGFSAPIIAVAILASMIAGEISTRFKIDKKKHILNEMIKELNLLQEKIDYVIQINGNLTSSEYRDIIKQFTTGA